MNPLQQLIKAVSAAREDPSMKGAVEAALTLEMEDWKRIATSARIAQAALRKIKKVGSQGHGCGTEEHEIAKTALNRITNQGRGS